MGDFITLIKTERSCNKTVTIHANGELAKKPSSLIVQGEAKTYHIPDLPAFTKLLELLSKQDNVTMVLGYVEGSEPLEGIKGDPFTIVSKARMAELHGVSKEDCPDGWHTIEGRRYITRAKAGKFLYILT